MVLFHHQVDFGKETVFTLSFFRKNQSMCVIEQSVSSMAIKLIQLMKEEEGN